MPIPQPLPAPPDLARAAPWRPALQMGPVLFVLGLLLVILATIMLIPAAVDVFDLRPGSSHFIECAGLTFVPGAVLALLFRPRRFTLVPRQMFALTALSWVVVSAFGSLPFLLGDNPLSLTDAVFESVSGVTTTGSTVLAGLDSRPRDILMWRSLLHWLGGIGIIAMAVAVLPFLRVGGMRLFRTESSEWSDKALPRQRTVIKMMVLVYLVLSVLCVLGYWAAGMTVFDAVNHAMATLSTGGFSPHDASVGFYPQPAVHWVGVVFMILGGLPFVLYVHALQGDRRIFLQAGQAIVFLAIIAASAAFLAGWLIVRHGHDFMPALTLAAFNVTSILTTTGFATADYGGWGAPAVMLFFLLTFVGACSGSTSGGLKIFRLQIAMTMVWHQVRRLLHPRGVFDPRYGGRSVPEDVTGAVMAFSFLYMLTIVIIAFLLSLMDLDFITSLSGAVTAVANVGPGLGSIIGPAGNFATLPDGAKWCLAAGMLLGRLEIFTLLVLFTRAFWRD